MVVRRVVQVTEDERKKLEAVARHDPSPAMRERCTAILKVAAGTSAHAVARSGLLRPRDPDTIYGWLDFYAAEGIAGLRRHRHGGSTRGRLRRRPGRGPLSVRARRGSRDRVGVA